MGRLDQGSNFGVKCTVAIHFIPKNGITQVQYITYANFVFDYKPIKYEPYRIRLVVGGNKLTHEEDYVSPTASLLENSINQ